VSFVLPSSGVGAPIAAVRGWASAALGVSVLSLSLEALEKRPERLNADAPAVDLRLKDMLPVLA
jgi:hypothetical protein